MLMVEPYPTPKPIPTTKPNPIPSRKANVHKLYRLP